MAVEYAKDQPGGFTNRISNVAVVGAGGHVGSAVVKALLAGGKHNITALTRKDSKSVLPAGVKTIEVDYDDDDTFVSALKNQDYLVISLSVAVDRDTDARLVKAAAKAGVKYVMPNSWGADITNLALVQDMYAGGFRVERFTDMEKEGVKWTAMCCGFWYEHSLLANPDLFGFDLQKKEATFYDRGETKIDVSTWETCGKAVAQFLSLPILPEDSADKGVTMSRWFNKPLYASDFTISQRDMFESILRVWGDKESDWKIKYQDVKERFEEGRKILFAGGPDARRGFGMQMYARMFFPNGDGNWSATKGLDNEVLGLKAEDLDEHTRNAKKMAEESWSYF
jgi:hypothetical protein